MGVLRPANSLSAPLGMSSAPQGCSRPFRYFQLPRLSVLHLSPLEGDSWLFLRWGRGALFSGFIGESWESQKVGVWS